MSHPFDFPAKTSQVLHKSQSSLQDLIDNLGSREGLCVLSFVTSSSHNGNKKSDCYMNILTYSPYKTHFTV